VENRSKQHERLRNLTDARATPLAHLRTAIPRQVASPQSLFSFHLSEPFPPAITTLWTPESCLKKSRAGPKQHAACPMRKHDSKNYLNQRLTKFKTVADPFDSPLMLSILSKLPENSRPLHRITDCDSDPCLWPSEQHARTSQRSSAEA